MCLFCFVFIIDSKFIFILLTAYWFFVSPDILNYFWFSEVTQKQENLCSKTYIYL
ncbi:hypothetical protein Nmel_007360 [Mimus melanotis]